jgi:hypothetical protein
MRSAFAVLLLSATVAAAGCGGGDERHAKNVGGTPDEVFKVRAEDGEAAPRVGAWKAHAGDVVALDVRAYERVRVHVHGYDILRTVDSRERIQFLADVTGVFEVELEDQGALLGNLAVYPD